MEGTHKKEHLDDKGGDSVIMAIPSASKPASSNPIKISSIDSDSLESEVVRISAVFGESVV